MKSNYKRLGEYIHKVDERNKQNNYNLLGLSMTKEYRRSTSNIVGTDLSAYKVMRKNRFVCDFMSVIRVYKLPVVLHKTEDIAIVSPAYTTFEVNDISVLLPEYLMLWFRREEFDRYAFFKCDSAIRGGFDWDALNDCYLPIPSLDEQQKFVDAYNVIENRIALKRKINDNLEAQARAVFKHECPLNNTKTGRLSELIEFRNGSSRPNEQGATPVYGGNGILAYVNQSNARNVVVVGRVGAYCGSLYLELGDCWVSDNAIYAKSKIGGDEFFDFILLKSLSISERREGTGQPLLTQTILNNIEIVIPDQDVVKSFNTHVKPLFTQIAANTKELDILSNLTATFLSQIST